MSARSVRAEGTKAGARFFGALSAGSHHSCKWVRLAAAPAGIGAEVVVDVARIKDGVEIDEPSLIRTVNIRGLSACASGKEQSDDEGVAHAEKVESQRLEKM